MEESMEEREMERVKEIIGATGEESEGDIKRLEERVGGEGKWRSE